MPGSELLARVAVDASLIPQNSFVIKDEYMRRCGRSILLRHRLSGAIIEIGVVKLSIFSTHLHIVEGVPDIRERPLAQFFCAIGIAHDHDKRHATLLVIGDQLLYPLLIHLRDRTVIAGEDNCQYLTGVIVLEAVGLAVDPGQGEVRGFRSDCKNGIALLWRGSIIA